MITPQQQMETDEAREAELAQQAVLTPEQEEERRLVEMAARHAAMDGIGQTLMGYLNEAVQFRAPYESEWVEDIRQYETGLVDRPLEATKASPSDDDEYLRAADNITRPATITYAARLADMLFPTNDRNWDLDITPDPDLPPEVIAEISKGPDGNGLPENMLEDAIRIVARKRMDVMRRQIDDQLAESAYADAGREVIMDACRIGHGVIKGPFAKSQRRRRYVADQGYRAVVEDILTTPQTTYVDPWLVYPRPCRRMEDCPGVFELHELSPKKVSDLKIQSGFSTEQIDRLLKMAPSWDSVASSMSTMRMIDDRNFVQRADSYPVFEYNGEMPAEAVPTFLQQLLLEQKVKPEQAAEIASAVEATNSLHVNCNVWIAQGIVLKLTISPIDYRHCLYHFFVFERRENSPFGKGVPRLLRDPQRSVRMLWAAIMLNTIMSSAPQIGVIKGALVPASGEAKSNVDLRCTRPRVWAFAGEVEDMQKAMQVFTVPSTAGVTLPVYERAKKNAEEQVMLPAVAQGEPTKSVPTSSGLAMLLNAGNIVQRRMAARWDADITTPLIESHYDWNMEHGKPEAKGDYRAIPRASSHLLVKDIQTQQFLTALNLFSTNPKLSTRMKDEAWAEEALRLLDLQHSRFLKTEDELAADAENNPPPPDPNLMKAEAAVKAADARALEAQTRAELARGELELAQQDRALDYEDRIADRASRERIAGLGLQKVLTELTAVERLEVMRLAGEMNREAARNATATRVAGMRAAAEAEKTASQERRDAFEVQVEAPDPRLA